MKTFILHIGRKHNTIQKNYNMARQYNTIFYNRVECERKNAKNEMIGSDRVAGSYSSGSVSSERSKHLTQLPSDSGSTGTVSDGHALQY